MGKSNKKQSDLFKLIYYRWKALIRSKEYQTFYKEKVAPLFKEIEVSFQPRFQDMAFQQDSFLSSLSKMDYVPSDFSCHSSLRENDMKMLYPAYPDEGKQINLFIEAEERFGLIVSNIEALIPDELDFSLEKEVWISFKEYVPLMPDEHLQKTLHGESIEDSIVREIDLSEDRSIKEYYEAFPRHKGFLIDPDMPFELIIVLLKKKLGVANTMRKQFADWEEDFLIWDIHKTMKRKDHYLETGRHMQVLKPNANEWKVAEDSKQRITQRVRHAVGVAQKLIDLAGKGQFVDSFKEI